MANFDDAFEKMIENEGGFKYHKVKADRGGQTYAGISRKYHPGWLGWGYIDAKDFKNPNLIKKVKGFYRILFWKEINGDRIGNQAVAENIFDFAVNAGRRTAVKLAQVVVDAKPDGIIGPITLKKLNLCDTEEFKTRYALAKVARYAGICNKDRTQSKFLLGWINRTLTTGGMS
ncbi:MAG: N-acetylmuramidase [Desulfobacteraceae bacterium]|nr:N-acetylmuramidase [Desulfobacteraceae bacterium]